MTGSNGLVKVGEGTLTLVAPAYTGNTTISAGTLVVNNPAARTLYNVAGPGNLTKSGGAGVLTLAGTGTPVALGALSVTGGTGALTLGRSINTGTFTMTGGALSVPIGYSISATGAKALAGALTVTGTLAAAAAEYDIIAGTGDLTGTFTGTVTLPAAPEGYDVELVYTATGVKLVVTAKAPRYTVTFKDADGEDIIVVPNVASGTLLSAVPGRPTTATCAAGSSFDGWDFPLELVITKDTTITAKCTPIIPDTYTVTFKDADGEDIIVVPNVAPGTLLEDVPNRPTTATCAAGSSFSGWDHLLTLAITKDTTITAICTPDGADTYTVTFVGPGGYSEEVPDVVSGTLLSAIKPTANPTCVGGNITWDPPLTTAVTGDMTVTATCVPIIYTVTYNNNRADATAAPVDPLSPYNSGATVTVLGPGDMELTDYVFAGWASTPTGAVAHREGDTFTINAHTTLYAVWIPEKGPNNPLTLVVEQEDPRVYTLSASVKLTAGEPLNEYVTDVTVELSRTAGGDPFYVKELAAGSDDLTLLKSTDTWSQWISAAALTPPGDTALFVGAETTIHYTVKVFGVDESGSLIDEPVVKIGTVTVGRPRPVLSGFTATALGPNQVRLTWDAVTAASGVADSSVSMIYILSATAAFASDLTADAVVAGYHHMVSADSMGITISTHSGSSMQPDTRYWFAAVLVDVVPASAPATLRSAVARADATTDETGAVTNIIQIDAAEYIQERMTFKVDISLTDDPPDPSEKLKYSYAVMLGDSEMVSVGGIETLLDNNLVKSDSVLISSMVEDGFGAPIRFDTTYTVYVFVTGSSGMGVGRSVVVGPFRSQSVVIAGDEAGVSAGATAANDLFSVTYSGVVYDGGTAWGQPGGVKTTVTVVGDDITGGFEKVGFLPLSRGYKIDNLSIAAPYSALSEVAGAFKIGIKPDPKLLPTVPTGTDLGKAKLYRFNNADNAWEVLFGTEIDGGYYVADAGANAWSDREFAYCLMINTVRPTVPRVPAGMTKADTDSTFQRFRRDGVWNIEQPVTDTFTISTNIGNAKVTYMYAQAHNVSAADFVRDTAQWEGQRGKQRSVQYTIPQSAVLTAGSGGYGMLVFLIINDGTHSDTINISGRVRVPGYGGVTGRFDGKWRPFASHVELDDQQTRKAFEKPGALFDAGEAFSFDNTRFRLMRWVPGTPPAAAAAANSSWREYKDLNDTAFNVRPGRLMWLKVSKTPQFDFGAASTISHVDDFQILLPPNEWTDFVLPFRYAVSLGEAFKATGGGDGIEVYRWDTLAGSGRYSAQNIYLSVPGLFDADTIVLDGGRSAYTIYNSTAAAVTLRVSPKPAALMARSPGAAKRALAKSGAAESGSLWYYTLRASTESGELPGVMIGRSGEERAIPPAPSFGGEAVVILDDDGKRALGHYFTPSLGRGGRSFKLRFINGEAHKTAFNFSLGASAGVPENMQVMFVNAVTGETLGSGADGLTVTVNAGAHEDILMAVGTRDYMNRSVVGPSGAKFVMGKISVNQAARIAAIKYYIPFAGVDRVDVSIYNLKGKLLWKRAEKVRPSSWNVTEWRARESRGGPTAAGLYIIRVRAVNKAGKVVAVENRRITFAR